MSFHYEKTATAEKHKQVIGDDRNIPDSIKKFLTDGIDGVAKFGAPADGFYVKAVGHLCNGVNSYDVTSADIKVQPMRVEK